ncbi:hypothetical protein [Tuwongella immobilis]|uniref:Uncharacterized protein n=1 Tax=Tuwongella immobilis TaxID=692036 RepID=A0A6C2YXN4_9BACT|nr:hypothetical protein [Tuwongella immobilis]VIP05535.1 Uncharacterized protein OS=Isosphaera pallida (strain ATCC 43644 / DSM 9630 / IS1B) GN=Isop_2342 PE=4 SV=1 [Tuwongella immobilis]VTS08426.1 Uncharacterized protein OS=Isosphaera pallida (strain ATCC 43644 / DSM 9630 / IS1B) GN=Isop_2342 PE=4 SV=1 [Tuwongella immobilis]
MTESLPESDPRFPSGRWVGFFLQKQLPGKHQMELLLTFANGRIRGEGRDLVGEFTINGIYELADGTCRWMKHYLGKHSVHYRGFNEGKGIWGTWQLETMGERWTGGFHIWPEGMAAPDGSTLAESIEEPVDAEEAFVVNELRRSANG